MKPKYNLAVVDDHSLFREGLVNLLKLNKSVNVLFEAFDGVHAAQLLEVYQPDILLLDIGMPGIMGTELIPTIKSKYPTIKIIVLSAHDQLEEVTHFVTLGASAFLPKHCTISELMYVIEKVSRYGSHFENEDLKKISKEKFPEVRELTDRELEVLRLFVEGRTINEIGSLLNLSVGTVSWYRNKLLNKTHTSSSEGLVNFANQHGLFKG